MKHGVEWGGRHIEGREVEHVLLLLLLLLLLMLLLLLLLL